uniref:Uncharacterized protein At2g29880 family n=1 Tax=Cajanus cajan TaxID=3821 RepID=A0A151RMU8_CAJCA|nr:Uncharacterized protein At2g29880 family [Cajanus cajan]
MYNHYLSRMKWLMRNNSSFGWDPITKTFTASDEVWKEYLKVRLLQKSMVDYMVGIETIAANFEKMSNLLEKRERYQEAKGNIWSAIKEIPNFDNRTHYMAANLLDTNAKKEFFLMLSMEERSDWAKYMLG